MTPIDTKLYQQVKTEAKQRFRYWPSVYGSMWLVKTYKQRGGRYQGRKPNSRSGTKRWLREKWTDQHGRPCGVNDKGVKKCRPTVRVSPATPTTWGEIDARRRREIIQEKKKIGMGNKSSNT